MSNISDLRFDDKNMNAHTAKGMGLLEKSLQQFGAGRSILIDKNNRIIGGNGVVEAAGNIGLEDVQIVESDGKKIIAVKRTDIDLDSKEGRELAMADNAVAAEDLSWDKGNIEEVSEQFGIDPGDWISDWDAQAEQEIVEDEAPEVDESEPAKSELGKVYQLGENRLMCGDSTDAGSVAILMDGNIADIAFASPPYNAGFGANLTKDNGRNKYTNGESDDKNREEYAVFLSEYIQNASNNSQYNFCDIQMLANNKDALFDVIYEHLDTLADIIIWDKGRSQPQLAENVLNSEFEFVFVFSKKANRSIGTIPFHGTLKNIVHISPGHNEYADIHNAVYPVDLPAHFVRNFAKESALDLFGGTGTTLIACEQLGRKCYMMELDPKYCDVIRKRYWKFTHDGNEEGWEKGTPAI